MALKGFALLCMVIALFGVAVRAQNEAVTLTPSNPVPRAQFGTAVTGKLSGTFGTSATTTTLGPCVMRSLHTHTETEFLYVIQGSIESYQIRPDGIVVKSTLAAGQGEGVTVPQAVIYPTNRRHLQYNPTCKPARFIAFFPASATEVGTTNIPAAEAPAAGVLPPNIRQILVNGPVPAPFSAANSAFPFARAFTPAAVGVFSFPATTPDQLNSACLRACFRAVPGVSGK